MCCSDAMNTINVASASTKLGKVVVAEMESKVVALIFDDGDEDITKYLTKSFPNRRIEHGTVKNLNKVVSIVDGEMIPTSVDFELQEASQFTTQVWKEIMKIPCGETRTYSELAIAIGRPSCYRAVARACGANRISIIIPCHRVISSNGTISGYRWGIERKKILLNREGILI